MLVNAMGRHPAEHTPENFAWLDTEFLLFCVFFKMCFSFARLHSKSRYEKKALCLSLLKFCSGLAFYVSAHQSLLCLPYMGQEMEALRPCPYALV